MTYRIVRTAVSGFRRLAGIDLNLSDKPFTVLIGANGVGKTSLLDAFSLLSASAEGELNRTLSELGGITSVATRDREADGVTLQVDMDVPSYEPLKYEVQILPRGTGYAITREVLSQQKKGYADPFKHIDSYDSNIRYFDIDDSHLVRPEWEHDPLESSLSQVPKMFRQPEELRRILSSATLYHVLDVGPRAPVKLPQQMKPARLPGSDGGELVPFLYYLREEVPDRFEAITDSLHAAFKDFEGLNFPPASAGMLAMTWKDANFKKPLYTHELSEGTIRFLWLVALLHSPRLPTITMIDEPEVSLHPELLGFLADLMREASRRTQLIVATHSDRLVRCLTPKEVLVMDVGDDGHATATPGEELNLDRWLDEYTMDEIWRMGRMGGRA